MQDKANLIIMFFKVWSLPYLLQAMTVYFQFHPGLYFILYYMYCQYSPQIVMMKLLLPYGHSQSNFLSPMLSFMYFPFLQYFLISRITFSCSDFSYKCIVYTICIFSNNIIDILIATLTIYSLKKSALSCELLLFLILHIVSSLFIILLLLSLMI